MSEKQESLLQRFTKRSDIALAMLLMTIIFMMIMPLPTLLVDTLIGVNMGLAILLLMLAIYLPTPLDFAAFPSVLLLSTLFRLALSISTTRLILTEADAGQIIQTFGEFVVGGNMVVGLVVFLIITIVQFIVITKGSERIAEVGARFSLDAMPGKQMSIDSDLRAGVISMQDARSRRERLEKESQLYGTMDGAMKFVKGDAIAGLIIIIVNILGGIAIGTMQRGMAVGEATELYSVLTIGDGLVSQIPALFVSITAGIIISRVTVDEDSNLGSDIGQQLMSQPKALMIAGAIIMLMGLIPGFPTIVFFFLASVLGLTGFLLQKVAQNRQLADKEGTTIVGLSDSDAVGSKALLEADLQEELKELEELKPLDPVLVELPESQREQVTLAELNQAFAKVRRNFYTDLGVPISGIGIKLSSQLGDDNYRILIRGVPVAQGQLSAAENNNLPANVDTIADGNQALQLVCKHLSYVLRRHAGEFVGIQEVHSLMNKLEEAGYVTLVQEAQRTVPTNKTVDILRRLLNESVSIRDLRQVLETLIEFGETEKDSAMLAERVRIGLRRQIAYAFTRGTGQLPAYMIDPESERTIQGSIRQAQTGIFLALPPDAAQALVNNVHALETQFQQSAQPNSVRPVILTSMDIRRHLRTHLETQFPDLPILSLQELPPTISVQPAGEIRLTQPAQMQQQAGMQGQMPQPQGG